MNNVISKNQKLRLLSKEEFLFQRYSNYFIFTDDQNCFSAWRQILNVLIYIFHFYRPEWNTNGTMAFQEWSHFSWFERKCDAVLLWWCFTSFQIPLQPRRVGSWSSYCWIRLVTFDLCNIIKKGILLIVCLKPRKCIIILINI